MPTTNTAQSVKALRKQLGQALGIAQVSDTAEQYEANIQRAFGTQGYLFRRPTKRKSPPTEAASGALGFGSFVFVFYLHVRIGQQVPLSRYGFPFPFDSRVRGISSPLFAGQRSQKGEIVHVLIRSQSEQIANQLYDNPLGIPARRFRRPGPHRKPLRG